MEVFLVSSEKTDDHEDDEDDHERSGGIFPDRARGRRRPRPSPTSEEAIEHDRGEHGNKVNLD